MRSLLRSLFAVSFVLLLPTTLLAQSQATTGVIEGSVTDSSGSALPGATVTVRNTATNYTQVLVAGEQGRFRSRDSECRTRSAPR